MTSEESEEEVYYYPPEVEVEDYEPFYLMRCHACNKPLCYFNGLHDGGKLCLDCAEALKKKKNNNNNNT